MFPMLSIQVMVLKSQTMALYKVAVVMVVQVELLSVQGMEVQVAQEEVQFMLISQPQ
jgi:hypothetical protein